MTDSDLWRALMMLYAQDRQRQRIFAQLLDMDKEERVLFLSAFLARDAVANEFTVGDVHDVTAWLAEQLVAAELARHQSREEQP